MLNVCNNISSNSTNITFNLSINCLPGQSQGNALWFFITALILAFFIIVINGMVLLLFLIRQRYLLVSPGNVMLLSLAVNDLLAGISIILHILPHCVREENESLRTYKTSLIAGYILAKLCLISTIGHLVMLSFDRLFAVSSPIKHQIYFTKSVAAVSIIFVWCISLALPLIEFWLAHKINLRLYSTTIIVFIFVVPLIILLHQYVITWKYIQKSMRATKAITPVNNSFKIVVLYLIMLVCFILTVLPYTSIRLLVAYDRKLFMETPEFIKQLFFVLRYFTSFINPLVYTMYKTDFQNAIKSLLFKSEKAMDELEMTFIRRSNSLSRTSFRKSRLTSV